MDIFFEERLKKLQQLQQKNLNPYEQNFKPDTTIENILKNFPENEKQNVKIAGRIFALRNHGKATFMHLKDFSGKIQLYFKLNLVGEENYNNLHLLDIGDIIGCEGEIFKTHTEEITVAVKNYLILSKCLHPLPEKWHGLQDIETRFRKRHLDLISNDNIKNIFVTRSNIIQFIRNYLKEKNFIEVETPMFHLIPGGATAKPFTTHHNALDLNLYLRIAPELYLKRLLVGGFEKIYEINRNFRNEGISIWHNPEFTMLELYQAYTNYEDIMNLTEDLIYNLVLNICEKEILNYKDAEINFAKPWQKITYSQSLKDYVNLNIENISDEEIKSFAHNLGIKFSAEMIRAEIIQEIFEKIVEPKLQHPTFIIDFPTAISPLAKRKADNEELTERFELFIAGREIANAFSELNDPFDQKKRFIEQIENAKEGENKVLDEDYINTLEFALPPTGGLGIGIDRLTMILTNSASIREVILFPLLKPE